LKRRQRIDSRINSVAIALESSAMIFSQLQLNKAETIASCWNMQIQCHQVCGA
jgi:hypothetical protein